MRGEALSALGLGHPCAIHRPSWKHVISPEAEIPYADFVIEMLADAE